MLFKENYGRIRRENSRSVRLGNMALMIVFMFCVFALSGAAVNCFAKISDSYDSAGNGMAAAEFIANRIRSCGGKADVVLSEDGSLDRIEIYDSGYTDVIFFRDGSLCESYVRTEDKDLVSLSSGDEIFSAENISASFEGENLLKITVTASNGSVFTAFAACAPERT